MRLAPDLITITLDGRRHVLRPSLRAATRLEASHGLAAILKGLAEGSFTIAAAVIHETADLDPVTIINALEMPALGLNLAALQGPLTAVVFAMYGIDPEAKKPAQDSRKPSKQPSAAESLAQLYRVATGWLGWTPAVAWSATVPEIVEARLGVVELHNLKHGATPEAEPEPLESKFASFAASLRARKAA